MDMIPGYSDDQLVKEVIKVKFKDQISALEEAGESAETYIEDRVKAAGEQVKAEINNAKGLFDQGVQTLVKTSALVVGLPAVMANPITIAVAQNTVQEIMGNVKTIISIIGSVQALLTTLGLLSLFSQGGSGTKLQEAAEEQASKAEESSTNGSVIEGWDIWDENNPRYNNLDILVDVPTPLSPFIYYLPPDVPGDVPLVDLALTTIENWYEIDFDGDIHAGPTPLSINENFTSSFLTNLGKGLYQHKSNKRLALVFDVTQLTDRKTSLIMGITYKGNPIPDGLDNGGNITTKDGPSTTYRLVLQVTNPNIS